MRLKAGGDGTLHNGHNDPTPSHRLQCPVALPRIYFQATSVTDPIIRDRIMHRGMLRIQEGYRGPLVKIGPANCRPYFSIM